MHPDDSARSVAHAVNCISRGFVGLDFREDVGDLRARKEPIPAGQADYVAMLEKMGVGDVILIQAHHRPLALVRVSGDYFYHPDAKELFRVWCRHLRPIRLISYYADYQTNPAGWSKITMTDTIAQLKDANGMAYNLIEKWLEDIGADRS